MALINSSQIQYPLSGSFSGSFFGDGSGLVGLNTDRIISGNVTASVNPIGDLFLIKSASAEFLKITSTETTVSNDVFIIKDNSNKITFKISESIIYVPTQSQALTGSTLAGSIYFTSSSFYVGLEN
jgi:hypothetical protein